MGTKISHSAVTKFQLCAKSYEYHYVKKIRPNVTSGALIFGSAFDNALNVLLMDQGRDAYAEFDKTFRFTKINDTDTYVPTAVNVVYANADFDADLVSSEDAEFLKTEITKILGKETSNYLELYDSLKTRKRADGFDSLSFDEKRVYNLCNWVCLRRKGHLMLDVYKRKVMPRIKKVHAIQEYVKLDNGAGDVLTGVVDLVAEIDGHGTVILDNKTSSMDYEADSVITSPQLSLYVHCLEAKYKTRKAGYIVLKKQVMKNKKKVCSVCGHDGSGGRHKTCDNTVNGSRCGGAWNETIDPDIYVQVIVDSIPAKTEEIVLENIDVINESIKCGSFHRNLNSCTNYWGGNCPYLGLCYRGDMTGLTDLEKEKKCKK